jgi:hypothetical protein
MAKASIVAIGVTPLSADHRRQVKELTRPITDVAQKFGVIRERLSELAPKVVKLFNAISAAHDGFTFVEFARLFDPSIPTHAADRDGETGYRNHKVYNTLTYMRRLVQTNRQGRRGQQGVRDSATDALARVLRTLQGIVKDDAPLWNAVQSEFQFSERLMTRLRKRVASTEPLIHLSVTKPATLGAVIHMERHADAEPQPEPMRAPARRVGLDAMPTPAVSARRRAS